MFYDAEKGQNTEKLMNEVVLANFLIVLKRREEERRGKTKGCEGKEGRQLRNKEDYESKED